MDTNDLGWSSDLEITGYEQFVSDLITREKKKVLRVLSAKTGFNHGTVSRKKIFWGDF